MKRVLVVGGAGYVGSHMVRLLVKNDYSVVVLDNLSTGFLENIDLSIMEFVKGDLGDEALLRELFGRNAFEVVFHFAALTCVGDSVSDPSTYYLNNVIKPYHLLEVMKEFGCKTFVFSSTAAVYGEPLYTPIDEKHPVNPINPYGNTKLTLEYLIRDYHDAYGLNYGILRYFNVCGAGDQRGDLRYPPLHFVPILQHATKEKKTFFIFGDDYPTEDGTCIRDYVHVDDLTEAHLLMLRYLEENNPSQIINLGTGRGNSVREIITLNKKITGLETDVKVVPRRAGDASKVFASCDKAKRLLGWEPRHSMEDILSSSWKWICSLE